VAADFVAFASGAAADELELDILRSAYEAARATESSE
jgi:exonuclease SbcD